MLNLEAIRTSIKENWVEYFITNAVGLLLLLIGVWTVPSWWCSRNGENWYEGSTELQNALSTTVAKTIRSDQLSTVSFSTGHKRYAGEWYFGTYVMAGLGFAQTAAEHPELREKHRVLMETCIERILSSKVKAFDRQAWGTDPIKSLKGTDDHAAYLGYFNLLLSYYRLLFPSSKYASLNDRITRALVRRLENSSLKLLESYPNQVFPVDNCAVLGSIGLYDYATTNDHSQLINNCLEQFRQDYIDSETGLLYQAVHQQTGKPMDKPRGSGTTLGLYFLSFVDRNLSGQLYQSVKKYLSGTLFGFGMVSEYPDTVEAGGGDIDSGPLILGYSVSSTGFCIGGSRIHGDETYYSRLFGTAYLFGAPLQMDGQYKFVSGGPLGNAIMYAMLTAHRTPLKNERKNE